MSNIIVVGDSFCASKSYADGWPALLAKQLNLNLICNAASGQHWWATKNFLQSISKTDWDQTEVIVFVHTFVNRIPNLNQDLALVRYNNLKYSNELDLAVGLYYKYIHDDGFMSWAQQAWFTEINQQWTRPKTIHLHGFDQSLTSCNLLSGVHLVPDLTSISLQELDNKDIWNLRDDGRLNHFSKENNGVLAEQIYNIIGNANGTYQFDLTKFKGTI